jgi:hypothetical protein
MREKPLDEGSGVDTGGVARARRRGRAMKRRRAALVCGIGIRPAIEQDLHDGESRSDGAVQKRSASKKRWKPRA